MIDTMYLKITDSCNLRCPFCYVNKNNKIMALDNAVNVIKRYNPKKIIFHGGEPLLFPALIINIMDALPDYEYSITSNLVFDLNDIQRKVLSRCDVATSYSVDRFNKDTFRIFKDNISWLKKIKDITLLVTLSYEQLKQEPNRLIENINELDCRYVLFERLFINGNDNNLSLLTDNYLLKLMQLYKTESNVLRNQMIYSLSHNCAVFNDDCQNKVITINSDMSTQSCPNSQYLKQTKKKGCLSCEFYQYCRGDCLSFQNTCMFPKNTFKYIKEEYKSWQ